ncbi:MAG TPA: hypothetical protein VMS56_07475 [Thermoanaerobaculia bacterium]|nr:hypothetical protein [Thermoanaerobaculia bacterium]
MFPPHLAQILDRFGVPADTQAALYDLYLFLGAEGLDAFAEWSSRRGNDPTSSRPEDLSEVWKIAVERYLGKHHGSWIVGDPTPTLFHPREGEGRFSGVAAPVGPFEAAAEGLAGEAARAAGAMVGPDQPLPPGVLILSRNGHYGGRPKTISFDVVADRLEDAVALSAAEGRQHTLPGSAGETTASLDGSAALIWEVQPNVLKPEGDRNREIRSILGRHRNWHVATLTAAILWLRLKVSDLWILRGEALTIVHEVNPARPVGEVIVEHHDRTVKRVSESLGVFLVDPPPHDAGMLLETEIPNESLRKGLEREGAAPFLWRLRW